MPGKRLSEEQRRDAILEAAYRVAVKKRLAGLTSREVAAEAGVSNGLVFFHFGNREELLLALLDWVIEHTFPAEVTAPDLSSAVRQSLDTLPQHRRRIELFFDYWFLASGQVSVRRKLRGALTRYRKAWEPLAAKVIAKNPKCYRGVSPASLSMAITSFIEGSAMQLVLSPRSFQPSASWATAGALLLEADTSAKCR